MPVSFSELVALNSRELTKDKGVTTARKEEGEKPKYAELVSSRSYGPRGALPRRGRLFRGAQRARGGQAAVAQVVMNRVKSGLYPTSICGVVYQNRDRYLGCQFTFACEGKSLRVTEPDAWARATKHRHECAQGRHLSRQCRRRLELPRELCPSGLGAVFAAHQRHRPPHLLQAERHRRIAGSGWRRGRAVLKLGCLGTASREPTTLSAHGPRAFDLMISPCLIQGRRCLRSHARLRKTPSPGRSMSRSSECSSRPSWSRRPTRAKASL